MKGARWKWTWHLKAEVEAIGKGDVEVGGFEAGSSLAIMERNEREGGNRRTAPELESRRAREKIEDTEQERKRMKRPRADEPG